MPGDFDLVKERVDIVQVIGEHVALKKAGRIYKALCPFHAEKTASFTVDPERRTYKCFGCSEFGDVFTFLEKKEGLTPSEALERLAERAGVEITRRRPEEREAHARLLAAHEVAHFYFRQALRGTPGGRAAARYLEGRGLHPDTVERFGLGYAPETRDGLLAYLRRKGFSDDECVRSGLVLRTERGDHIDRFRDRVIVPIRDTRGRAVAFAGRALRADQQPKYTNSPTTPLFEKGSTLFALDLARPAIRRGKEAVVVEGQFDAIAAHQAGFANVVASMGTALTEPQYRLLQPLTGGGRVVVAFDPDEAGGRAAEARTRELLSLYAVSVPFIGTSLVDLLVALLPSGEDPDALARRDPDALRRVIAESKPVVEFLLDLLAGRHDLASDVGRVAYLREALRVVAVLPDPIRRALYLGRLSMRTGVGQAALEEQLRTLPASSATRAAAPAAQPGKVRPTPERYLVAQLLRFPEQARQLELPADSFGDPELRAIFDRLSRGETPERLPDGLRALAAELTEEVAEPASVDELVTALELAALRIRERGLRRQLDEARAALARDEADRALAAEVGRLTAELQQVLRAREQRTVLERASAEAE